MWYLNPPSRNDAPNKNSVLVTIAPATEAFTNVYCPARNAVSAMMSSVKLPNVALRRPPTVSPVLEATELSGVAQQSGKGYYRQERKHKKQSMRLGLNPLDGEHCRYENQ